METWINQSWSDGVHYFAGCSKEKKKERPYVKEKGFENLFHNDKMKSNFKSWACDKWELPGAFLQLCKDMENNDCLVSEHCVWLQVSWSHSFFLCCHSYSPCVAAVKVNFCLNSATLVWLVDGKVDKGDYVHGTFLGGRTMK